MEIIGKITIGLLLFVLNVLLRGYAISWLWFWFAVPVFNVPIMNVWQAIGVSFLIGCFTAKVDAEKKEKDAIKGFFEVFSETLIVNTMFLVLGYILHLVIR